LKYSTWRTEFVKRGLRFSWSDTNYDIVHFVKARTWLDKEYIVDDRLHGKYSDRFISSGFRHEVVFIYTWSA
jgi:hypothetical protein